MAAPRKISRDAVLAAALRIADADGVDAVSMRRVARDLGVGPMALYKHLPGKTAILDGILEAVLAEVQIPQDHADPAAALREGARSFRRAALRHPRVFPLIALRPVSGPAGLAVTDAVARLLRAAGLKPAAAIEAYKVLDAFLIGFTSLEVARLGRPATPIPPLDRYPDLAGLLDVSGYADQDDVFDRGLTLLLDGLLE